MKHFNIRIDVSANTKIVIQKQYTVTFKTERMNVLPGKNTAHIFGYKARPTK